MPRKLDQFDMRAHGLFNMVRNEYPDDEVEDAIGEALRRAYEAGLHRAQELAMSLTFETHGEALHILAPELYEAIDAEVAKEQS